MGTKWYEVTIVASKTAVIEIDENCPRDLKEEAEHEAMGELFFGCDTSELNEIHELKTDDEIERAKRHADEYMPLN